VATLASELGVDVPAVAAMLNHSDIHTVQKYIHRNSAADEAREKGAAASGHVESDGLILPEWHNATAGKSASTLAILSPTDPYTL